MAETYYYMVRFHALCEECGKNFEGVVSKEVPVNDSAIAGNIGNAIADAGDLAIRRKSLESAVRDKCWSDLDMNYGILPIDHCCPHCGARQSWDPMPKPEEPTRTAKGKAGNMGCFLFAAFFVGGIISLIVYIIQSFVFYESDPTIMFIVWAACLVVGIVLAVRSNAKDDKEADATYPERMKDYERQLAVYDDYQAKVAARTTRHEPVVDLASGVTFSRKLAADEWCKADLHYCPSCGKRLEGTVRMNSIQAGRAAAGDCPWCGSSLPSNRRVYLK
ncbi:MAG: hypothetical protein IKG22_00230 [Atopobiaceae bacterium]|nr:hypothetical protein [Atopobiaceae bacterium]